MEEGLEALCLDAATASAESVEVWRRQHRTLDRLPSHLSSALLRRLHRRRLLFPSLLEVFRNCVEDVDLKGEGRVNAEWMAYLGGFRYLRSLNLADCKAITNSALWSISAMTTLEELDLSRCTKVSDVGIKHLLSNTNLQKLSISETRLSGDGVITCFTALENLRVLDLGGLPVSDKALSSLEVLKNLEHLDLWGSKISDEGVNTLKAFPRLSFLNVAWTNVHRVPALPSITCLNMSFCRVSYIFNEGTQGSKCLAPLSKLLLSGSELKNESEAFSCLQLSFVTFLDLSRSSVCEFHFLADMKRLEYLNLSNARMTDELVANIASIGANLLDLNLSNTKITSYGISILVGNVPKLEVLLLSHSEIDDVSLSYLSLMPALKLIDLSYTKIRGFTCPEVDSRVKASSLSVLNDLNYLENLCLQGIQLTDDTSYPLIEFKRLKSLSLESNHLTDHSLLMLSRLPNLEFLRFCGAVLTNAGLLLFEPPSTLKKLDLRGCWLLTSDTISAFLKRFLHIDVKHELLPSSHVNQEATGNSSHAHGLFQPWQVRPSIKLPPPKFVDERLKYSREELLKLQYSRLSDGRNFQALLLRNSMTHIDCFNHLFQNCDRNSGL